MVAIMMLTSKGTAGIAGGAFIILASTVSSIGTVPVASLALIVGIDRILNEGRVFINVLGNAVATIVIGKWENDFDHDRAKRVLAGEPVPPLPTATATTAADPEPVTPATAAAPTSGHSVSATSHGSAATPTVTSAAGPTDATSPTEQHPAHDAPARPSR